MCPSSRYTKTGLSGVTESIHSRAGSGVPGQRSWSQSPPRIHSPGFRSEAKALSRWTNSCRRVGRPEIHARQLEAAVEEVGVPVHEPGRHQRRAVVRAPGSPVPPGRRSPRCRPPPRSCRPSRRRRRPTAWPSPRSRPGRTPPDRRDPAGGRSCRRPGRRAGGARAGGRANGAAWLSLSAELGEAADGFELLQGAAARRRRPARRRRGRGCRAGSPASAGRACRRSRDRSSGPRRRTAGAVVGLAVDRLEVGEDAVAGRMAAWYGVGKVGHGWGVEAASLDTPLRLPPDPSSPTMSTHRQDHPLLRRPALRGPRALVPQDPARGGGRPHRGRGHRREDRTRASAAIPLTVDTNVDEIAAADFDGLVIPGGYAPDIMRRSPQAAPAHPGDLRGGQAGRLHLPRGLGADLRRDRAGQAGHQRRRHQGRPGQRRPALGGQPGGGGRQPHLLAHAGGPAPLHARR